MKNEQYSIKDKALEEVISFFTELRKKYTDSNIKNLSQATISCYTGITKAELSRIETRKRRSPGLDILLKLASFYNLSEEQIVEFYKFLCNKSSKLLIVDRDISIKTSKVELEKDVLLEIKEFFQQKRKEKELSQREIMQITGVCHTTICKLETNVIDIPSLDVIIPLCKLYGVSEEQVADFYSRATKSHSNGSLTKENNSELGSKSYSSNLVTKSIGVLGIDKPSKFDELSKQELIEIIVRQNEELTNIYAKLDNLYNNLSNGHNYSRVHTRLLK